MGILVVDWKVVYVWGKESEGVIFVLFVEVVVRIGRSGFVVSGLEGCFYGMVVKGISWVRFRGGFKVSV